MSQQSLKTGRRTPLSLNATKQQTNEAAKNGTAAGNPPVAAPPTSNPNKNRNNGGSDKSTGDNLKQPVIVLDNFDQLKESSKVADSNKAAIKKKTEQPVVEEVKSKKADKKEKKERENPATVDLTLDEKPKKDQKEGDKPSSTNGTNGSEANGNGDTSADKKAAATSDVVRESPRQKALRETKEKEDELQKKREQNKPKITGDDDSVAATISPQQTASPGKKTLNKNGTTDVEEESKMPILSMDEEDIPLSEFGLASKILKLKQSPPATPTHASNRSPYASRGNELPSYINLSPNRDAIAPASSSTPTVERINYAVRTTISARKSLRMMREDSLSNCNRDSYRSIPNDFNDTSMNVTVGSEVPNDSFRTSFFLGGRKRTALDASNDDMNTAGIPVTPKKVRLDFSGLLGFVASPVTKLRARFQRAKIDTNQPSESEVDASVDAPVEEALVDGTEVVDDVVEDKEQLAKELIDDVAEAVNLNPEGPSDIKSVDEVAVEADGDEQMEDNDDIVMEAAPRKSRCVVM